MVLNNMIMKIIKMIIKIEIIMMIKMKKMMIIENNLIKVL